MIEKISKFDAQVLANTVYAYAALQLPGAMNVLPLIGRHFKDELHEFKPRELLMVLWAFTRCSSTTRGLTRWRGLSVRCVR